LNWFGVLPPARGFHRFNGFLLGGGVGLVGQGGHVEKCTDNAGAGFANFDFGREGAVSGIECDLFDGFDLGCGFAAWQGFGEVEAGYLEAVEEQAGAAGIDFVGGDAPEDLADGVLDGASVFGMRKVEVCAAAAALARVFDGAAGGVVVVAKFFVTEAGAAAATSVGEDVAALVALFGLVIVGVHVVPLSLWKLRKVFKRKDLHPYFDAGLWLNGKVRLGGRTFLCS
jgi:hypothetical protein